MVFIRYSKHPTGYVMDEEHPNGGIKKIDSRSRLYWDEFPNFGEIKKNLKLYEL